MMAADRAAFIDRSAPAAGSKLFLAFLVLFSSIGGMLFGYVSHTLPPDLQRPDAMRLNRIDVACNPTRMPHANTGCGPCEFLRPFRPLPASVRRLFVGLTVTAGVFGSGAERSPPHYVLDQKYKV